MTDQSWAAELVVAGVAVAAVVVMFVLGAWAARKDREEDDRKDDGP